MDDDYFHLRHEELRTSLRSIEQKLDALIAALAEDEEPLEVSRTLAGEVQGGARDQSQPL
jgi:hypothetical protein